MPTWFLNGGQDPATDIDTLLECLEMFPLIKIDVLPKAWLMLLFQHYETLIPRIVEAAARPGSSPSAPRLIKPRAVSRCAPM